MFPQHFPVHDLKDRLRVHMDAARSLPCRTWWRLYSEDFLAGSLFEYAYLVRVRTYLRVVLLLPPVHGLYLIRYLQ